MLKSVCIASANKGDKPEMQATYAALRYEKSVQAYTHTLEKGAEPPKAELYYPVSYAARSMLESQNINPANIVATFENTQNTQHAQTVSPSMNILASAHRIVCYSDQERTLSFLSLTPEPKQLSNWDIHKPVLRNLENRTKAINNTHQPTAAWSYIVNSPDPISRPEVVPLVIKKLLRQLGVNLWILPIFEHLGHKVSTLPQTIPGSLASKRDEISLRACLDHIYLDLDDTLICHGAINPHVMAFIYACNDYGCPITLITRHYRNPTITLAEFGVKQELFTKIEWITDGRPKSAYMAKTGSNIFIDDAFKERAEVISSMAIPSFPPDITELLSLKAP